MASLIHEVVLARSFFVPKHEERRCNPMLIMLAPRTQHQNDNETFEAREAPPPVTPTLCLMHPPCEYDTASQPLMPGLARTPVHSVSGLARTPVHTCNWLGATQPSMFNWTMVPAGRRTSRLKCRAGL